MLFKFSRILSLFFLEMKIGSNSSSGAESISIVYFRDSFAYTLRSFELSIELLSATS